MVTLELDRESVLAHRAVVQDLASPVREAVDCSLLGLGLQNTPPGSGPTGVNARTSQSAQSMTGLLDQGGPLAVVLAARGAPHVVARSELPLLTAGLFPFDQREAAQVDEVARAIRKTVQATAISRPALSAARGDVVDDSLQDWCERCASRHVREGLFRKATLAARLELDAVATSPTMFRPSGVHVPAKPGREHARAELVRRYVHFTGVAGPADLAAWLGYQAGEIRATWDLIAAELTPCTVAGKRRWALTSDLASLSGAARPRGAKLLPPSDPYLLGDRSLVVPEREHQRQLWRAQANPGAILVNGEVAGIWRQRISGRQLRVTLHPFVKLDAKVIRGLARQAEEVAALRGAHEADLTLGAAGQD